MDHKKQCWLTRERSFAAFATGPLLQFWQQRVENTFIGVDNVPIRYVRFTSPSHDKVILISPGRIESYVKYPELAYDFFHCGYDVLIVDHRGQGRSGRLLNDSHRGHVVNFDDYVVDLETLWRKEVAARQYRRRYALGHSMGGAVLARMLAKHAFAFDAVALTAPMLGIVLPMPRWLAQPILNWAEERPALRESYALGTGRWNARPFGFNHLTHSRERYRRNLRFYADDPGLRIGGPTYHWVRESIMAGEAILRHAADIVTPLLMLQASEEKIVDNTAQNIFCKTMTAAGRPCAEGKPKIIVGARHEILFETDNLRAQALEAITAFFSSHDDSHA